MACENPVYIAPRKENQYTRAFVPCGKCLSCLKTRRNEWVFRLKQEYKSSFDCSFVTLTYDDNHLKYVDIPNDTLPFPEVQAALHYHDVRLFLARLRKCLHPNRFRYVCVGEYGDIDQRPHYHIVFFNLGMDTLQASSVIEECWTLGICQVEHPRSVGALVYITKYITKHDNEQYVVPPFLHCSKGLGASYLTPAKANYHVKNNVFHVTQEGGFKSPLPRYYKDKIFSTHMKLRNARDASDFYNKNRLKREKKYGSDIYRLDQDALSDSYRQMAKIIRDRKDKM